MGIPRATPPSQIFFRHLDHTSTRASAAQDLVDLQRLIATFFWTWILQTPNQRIHSKNLMYYPAFHILPGTSCQIAGLYNPAFVIYTATMTSHLFFRFPKTLGGKIWNPVCENVEKIIPVLFSCVELTSWSWCPNLSVQSVVSWYFKLVYYPKQIPK